MNSDYASQATDRSGGLSLVVLYWWPVFVCRFCLGCKRALLASTEAAYVAIAEGIKEATFLLRYI